MKPKILISDEIHEKAVEEAEEFAEVDLKYNLSPKQLKEQIGEYEAIIVRSGTKLPRETLEEAGRLKAIGRAGVGLDNIDLEAAEQLGIKVFNSPEASTISVAELVIGSLISFMRNIHLGHHSLRKGEWNRSKLKGKELFGKKLGIVGFGRIGREVADRARGLGMEVHVFDPNITKEDARENNVGYMELEDLLRESDFISVHCPLTEKTCHMIDSGKLKQMKQEAVIINAARGGIVKEEDLKEALKRDEIGGAILDVYEEEPPEDEELLLMDNVLLIPHLGASTEEAQINAGTVVVEKIRNLFRNQ